MPGPQSVCVYQFKVVLRGISPMIWRRLLLRSDHSVADLHYAIQIAMGWSDSHLHQFHIHGREFGVEHEGGVGFSDDPEKVHLADFGFRLRERFLYEYDFYDVWEQDVRLEKLLAWSPRQIYPVCTGGKRLRRRRIAAGRGFKWKREMRGGGSGGTLCRDRSRRSWPRLCNVCSTPMETALSLEIAGVCSLQSSG
jgi:hypothetical protein